MTATHSDLLQFYARQCYLLDEGRSREWAHTFVADGSFSSPSYDAPAQGHDELEQIGNAYIDNGRKLGVRSRHVASNIWLDDAAGTPTVRGYFTLIATKTSGGAEVSRHTQFTDTVSRTGGELRVVSRVMTVDNGHAPR